ncbi:MAG TPA: glycosyltransferase family 39 protein, partial [Polyangiales bacterium]|nr:glycosyltransferase family 39 protein [Polyangiales bacterium]
MLNRSVALEGLVLVAVLLLTVCGIGSFGIWDPWELVVAEAARNLSASGADSSLHTPLTTWLVAAAFDAFGAHEWSGRLPGVIAAILSGVLALVLLARPYGRRAGIIALAVMASTPMFLLNARLLMGDAIA